ncbi:MAG TPA: carbohydrate kinase [Solirubrobacteraceae bacterium]|nr:carbohydrate kinase [Solirubrobacteraceae bacterium]
MRSDERILVAGEALVDLVPADDGTLSPYPGGGPFTTARALGRLGRPVAFAGRLGTDRFGERMTAMLSADGVALDAAERTEDPTTLALAEVDAAGAARYRFYTEGTSAPELEAANAGAPAVVHVGTLGLVLEPMAGAVEALVGRLAGRALVMVDPNIRPAAIADEAAYRARLDRVLAGADVVKVSDEDLGWLAPGETLLERGPAVTLVTRGGEGATVHGAFGSLEVAAPPVAVVDTIGAGDTFSAGWLAWWTEHGLGPGALGGRDAVAEATGFACRAAALTCSRAGADPPRRGELP